jgi:hypothetical protein
MFTNFVPEAEVRWTCGYLYIGLIGLTVIGNVFLILANVASGIKRKMKERKAKKALELSR